VCGLGASTYNMADILNRTKLFLNFWAQYKYGNDGEFHEYASK
jgi:hypothetical protein